jgi:hypothetical protein
MAVKSIVGIEINHQMSAFSTSYSRKNACLTGGRTGFEIVTQLADTGKRLSSHLYSLCCRHSRDADFE